MEATTADDLAAVLGRHRFHYIDEIELHAGIAMALTDSGIPFEQEVTLPDRGGRIDFVVDGQIGVEVKIQGSPAEVERQLRRYVDSGQFSTVVLVTTRARQAALIAADALDGVEVLVLR